MLWIGNQGRIYVLFNDGKTPGWTVYADAFKNRGMAMQALDRHGEALADFDRAIAIRPHHAPTHFTRSVCLLQAGDLPRGWRDAVFCSMAILLGPSTVTRFLS